MKTKDSLKVANILETLRFGLKDYVLKIIFHLI